jgi:small-conductance mechanosensitive channel
VALVLVMFFSVLARLFNASSETLLAPFVRNVMLRSVVGSLISSGLVLAGLLAALSILNLTHAVLSILGLAGVVGLAVGFAFKDITENFIASVLLGVRRPFQVGDYVTVAGQSGVVKSLNTRATVLVTLEGNHIRIPNNVVYKEILVNASASVSFRGSFDVVVPYEASTAAALEAMTRALREVAGVLPEPPARALVEALEPGGVRLRAYYWTPVRGVDWFQLGSDAKLRVKVALQQAGIFPAAAAAPAPPAAAVPSGPDATPAPARAVAPGHAESNLRRDARAAEDAKAVPKDDRPTPMEHVLNAAESRVSEEGTNLLVEARSGT